MYNCKKCKKTIGPGIATVKVATKTRPKTYTNFQRNRDGDETETVTQGWEIEAEEDQCFECSKKELTKPRKLITISI